MKTWVVEKTAHVFFDLFDCAFPTIQFPNDSI